MDAGILAQGLLSGLAMGLVYALIAAGLTLIFGLMDVVNFAHGDFMMVGMFLSFTAWSVFHIDPMLSLPLVVVILFIFGIITYRLLIRRLLKSPPIMQIFATFGLGLLLQGSAQAIWSPNFKSVTDPIVSGSLDVLGMKISSGRALAGVISLLAFGLLYCFIYRTNTGLAMRATAEDRDSASMVGIDPERMHSLAWGIGLACVGVAAALMMNFYFVFPSVGVVFALIAFVTVALGGFGSVLGALYAGIAIGLIESGVGLFASEYKYASLFLLYLLIVYIRPQGFLGKV